MKRIVFMGTPAFSVNILTALAAAPEYEVVAVVTQPDRPVGRKKTLTPSPVKEAATAQGIPVYQPENISQAEDVKALMQSGTDLIVTAAYGQFLPASLLTAPKYGAINVHASLLPKYRGGAPVHYAIWQGEEKTGVTIMEMVEQMDAGAILAQAEVPIAPSDNVAVMFDKLSVLGRDLLLATLPKLFAGELTPVPQDETQATYSPNITREEERIDWTQTAAQIHNQIRAFNSWPVAHTLYDGQRWKIWQSAVAAGETTTAAPGTVIEISKKPAALKVACGSQTVLAIIEIQPAGKKPMSISNFINGGAAGLEEGAQFDNRK